MSSPEAAEPSAAVSAAYQNEPVEISSLVHATADAWREALAQQMPLIGFFAALETTRGPQMLAADGCCAPLGEASSLFAAFRTETSTWRGTAEQFFQRTRAQFPCAQGAYFTVRVLRAGQSPAGLIVAVTDGPVDDETQRRWEPTFTGAAGVAALAHERYDEATQAGAIQALDTIATVLSSPTDSHTLYAVIHREVSRVMECDSFYVCLYDGGSRLDFVYAFDQGNYADAWIEPLGDGPTSFCIHTCQPFVLSELNQRIHHSGTYLGEKRFSQSAIHVPMLVNGRPIGVLSAQSYRPNAYTETHVQILAIIAAKAGIAVRNSQLLERVHGQVDRLEKLSHALDVRDRSLERVGDLVVTTDADGFITAYNEAVCRALGYGPTELIGRSIINLRESGRGSWEAFCRARNRRISVLDRSGKSVPILYSTEPLYEDGKIVGWLTVAKNMTDLERSEQEGRIALALERQRISRDLHDGLIQSLSIAKMQLQILQRNNADEKLRSELSELQETLSRGLTEARHYIVDLKHAQLSNEGLIRTARQYAHELGRVTGLSIGVSADTDSSPLSDTEEVQLFYILREALNNVRKHAEAKRVRVEFRQLPAAFVMSVEDDGQGFDPEGLVKDDATGGHWGLQHIVERAQALGGKAEISSVPGHGTRVTVRMPVGEDARRVWCPKNAEGMRGAGSEAKSGREAGREAGREPGSGSAGGRGDKRKDARAPYARPELSEGEI